MNCCTQVIIYIFGLWVSSAILFADEGMVSRGVRLTYLAVEQGEGRGARVRRTLGRRELQNFDPFLMLDEFHGKAPGGFPDHPHRGFSTVSYILPSSKGSFEHQDFRGHKGIIGPGDVQWMRAGKGIVHSEMPMSSEHEVDGLQLWVNLPKELKMSEPSYQELPAKEIPEAKEGGVFARVIAGDALGVSAAIITDTPVHYIHYTIQPGSDLKHEIPESFNTFLYVLNGTGEVGVKDTKVKKHMVAILDNEGGMVQVRNTGSDPLEFVLVGGEPIGEPIVQYGPFVMDSAEGIEEAFQDYQLGKNGFERARTWSSGH